MNKNSIINSLNNTYEKSEKEYLNFVIFLLSFANLQTKYDNENSSIFFDDIIENFNQKIEQLSFCKEFYTVLSMIENYQNISNEYEINTKLFKESQEFYNFYFKNIITEKIYLNRFQQQLFIKSISGKNYAFCMPTSFGKSLIIRLVAIYRANQNKRTIICVPTLALLNEYRIEIDKLNSNKNIVISSSWFFEPNFDILISTQERLIDLKINKNDLLIIDESYTIDDNNLRGAILKSLVNKSLLNNNNIIFFQPNIVSIKKDSFLQERKIITKFINYKFCTQQFIEYDDEERILEKIVNITYDSYTKNEKIGIYSLKNNHLKYAEKISLKLNLQNTFKDEKWFKLLEEIYTNNYLPINYLSKGILIHNGNLPKFFRFISESVFKNNKNMLILICNNTLTKGINFALKNLIINSKNGISNKRDIDGFEIKNLIGRIGRYSTNNLYSRIGKIYVIFSNNEIKNKIVEINDKKQIEYNDNATKQEKENYLKHIKNINDGTFLPWKFILDNFNNDNEFVDFLLDWSDCIITWYETKSNKEKFYEFIIELFGGKEKFVEKIFFSNKDKKIFSSKEINFYINKSKYAIFSNVFENIDIKELVVRNLQYYTKFDYFYNKNTGRISKEEFGKAEWKKLKDIHNNHPDYKLVFTWLINDFSHNIDIFYSANFMLIEPQILAIMKEKFSDFEPKNDYINLDIMMDKYNIPNDFREHLIKNNIFDEESFIKSNLFELLQDIKKGEN